MKKPRFAFSIPTHGDAEQRALFEGFASAGFAGLQLKGGQYARYLDAPERFLAEWGEFEGGRAALITGGSLDENGVASLRRTLNFAGAIGAEMVVFCHGQARATVGDAQIRGFARQLSELGAEAASRGVKLSLHNHFDNPVMHRADFDTFFGSIEPGTVGLTLDTAHLQKSGVFDIAGVVRDFGDFLDNVHLKDFAAGQFQTLGRGEIAFEAVFTALHDLNFAGWLCADEESDTGLEASLRASFAFLEAGWNSARTNL